MHHYHQDQQKHLTPAMATIPLVLNGYDKIMGERVGDTITFMHPGFGIVNKLEQKTDKGYIELTLGARIGIGPHGSTYMVKEWQSGGTVNLGAMAPDWVAYYKATAQWNQAVGFVEATGVGIMPTDWISWRNAVTERAKSVALGIGCPHQWEQKPLLTGNYHKCLLCGEEKV